MNTRISRRRPSLPASVLLIGVLLATAGCKWQPGSRAAQGTSQPSATGTPAASAGRGDADISNDVQGRIRGESALNGQNIQVSVNNGVATLDGSVANDASRALASNDAAAVSGVRTVINNLTVSAITSAIAPPASLPEPVPQERAVARRERNRDRSNSYRSGPDRRSSDRAAANPGAGNPGAGDNSQTASNAVAPPAQPVGSAAPPMPAPPPEPPKPVAKTVTVASGTTLPVRLTETLDSAHTQTGDTFHGSLANDLIADGMLVAPRGSSVVGRVIEAKDATHFAGAASLSVELTSLASGGRQVAVVTTPYVQQGKGRGRNTAEKAGGGAALGAIIGALAGGGRGAAIGAASGGALGTGVNGVTRGQQVQIPSETLINFQLQSPITVTTSRAASGETNYDDNSSPQLHPR